MTDPILRQAIEHHRAGRLVQAEPLYRQVLTEEPNHPEATHLLGVLALQAGHPEAAMELIRKAISLHPQQPEFHSNLGLALGVLGKSAEAMSAFQCALALRSDYPEAWSNLGGTLSTLGRSDEAIDAYHKAIALRPSYAEAHNNLGAALASVGRCEEAIDSFRQAIAARANYPGAWNGLGAALYRAGRLDEALASYRKAIELKPDYSEARNNLGVALRGKKAFEESIASCREAIRLRPDYADAHNNLARAMQDAGMYAEAIEVLRAAVARWPGHANLHNSLGNALWTADRPEAARDSYARSATVGRGTPEGERAHSNLLLAMNYPDPLEPAKILEEAKRWEATYAAPLFKEHRPFEQDRSPDRRLRIGYVSPDLRSHAVASFAESLLAGHDRARFEVFCYADLPISELDDEADPVTTRLRGYVGPGWRTVTTLSDAPLAERIRADRIDVLVDLAGHTAGNRLLVFARRPAPIQVTYLGYPGTTGLSTIDYRFTDEQADPTGLTDGLHSEKLIRLSTGAWCYSAPEPSPPTVPAPCTKPNATGVTFGSFNAQAKLSDRVLKLWAEILRRAPSARLVLKAAGMTEPAVRERILSVMNRSGVGEDRVELIARVPDLRHHHELYHRIDLALDSFPYHGTTTTCEALWMGVPVLTLAGPAHVSRVGVSLLHRVGMDGLIAPTDEAYVDLAVAHTREIERIVALREGLRARLTASPLMDRPAFCREVERQFHAMWVKDFDARLRS